jgi:catalase
MEDWERDDLVNILASALKQCNPDIQERMIALLTKCDEDYWRRVAEGIGRGSVETSSQQATAAD